MKNMIDMTRIVYTLRHLETGEYVCLRQEGEEYLAVFSSDDSALRFRSELHLVEFVDTAALRLSSLPFQRYYLDGELLTRPALAVR